MSEDRSLAVRSGGDAVGARGPSEAGAFRGGSAFAPQEYGDLGLAPHGIFAPRIEDGCDQLRALSGLGRLEAPVPPVPVPAEQGRPRDANGAGGVLGAEAVAPRGVPSALLPSPENPSPLGGHFCMPMGVTLGCLLTNRPERQFNRTRRASRT